MTLVVGRLLAKRLSLSLEREGFNTYILQDGTKLKFKAVVAKIVCLDAYRPDGEPVYMVNASNVMVADVPDGLKRKPEEQV